MIKGIILHNNFIKITSCLIGYAIWAFLAQYQTITTHKQIPLCFYGIEDNYKISAPDFINLALSHTRKHLYLLQKNDLAIHIDASQYKQGTHYIHISRENLFLPDQIKLEYIDRKYIEFTIVKDNS